MSPRVVMILGCTAVGKGAAVRAVARRTNAEIVSVDSMKVYRGMDIGTAKPSAGVRQEIPHHLIDVVDPWEEFSVAQFVEQADAAIRDISARGRLVLAVGGTGLYLKALSEGLFDGPSADPAVRTRLRNHAARQGNEALHAELARVDPEAAARIHRRDLRRIVRALEVFELTGTPISVWQTQWDRPRRRYQITFVGLRRDRDAQARRINTRVREMCGRGLVGEAEALLRLPRPLSAAARRALGYAEIFEHLHGRVSLAEAVEMIKIHTRQFAKAQRTWFKRFRETAWLDLDDNATADTTADEILRRLEAPWSTSPK